MQIIQQLPHPALAPYVRCYWEIYREIPPGTALKVPFGCTGRTHWMITLQNTFRSLLDRGGELGIYNSTLVGQITRPMTHHITTTTCVLLVDFTATGLHTLWPFPVHELYGQNFETEPVLGADTHSIAEQLLNTPDRVDRFAGLNDYLLGRLRRSKPTDGRVEAAVRLIQQKPGHVHIRQLAAHLNCSERTLNRRFSEMVGLSPKYYARVQRFLQAQRWLAQHPAPDWHDLSASLGYYDQAHLIHEFQYFTGKSPLLYGTDHKPLLDVVRQD